MDDSIRLGRVAGVQIGVNWSLILAFWLIVWSLAGGLLQSAVPDLPPRDYWLAGTAAAMLFYVCLLAHELAHALLARSLGLEVDGITLWLFGGVARLRQDAPRPGLEARIALAGPAASVALAAGFAVVAWGLGGLGAPGLAAATSGWLGLTNLLLALFNLAPAYPLDGGRILRAALWRRSGDRDRATRQAAAAGRTFAYLLIGASLLGLLAGRSLASLWIVFLGWFLLAATRSEASRAQFRSALAGLRVEDVMSRHPVVAPSYITVEEFVRSYVLPNRQAAYPLKSFEGRLDGLVAVSRVGAVARQARRSTPIRDVACPTSEVPVAHPDELVTDVLPRLGGCAEGRALVLLDGNVVGILAPADLEKAIRLHDGGDHAGPIQQATKMVFQAASMRF